MIEEGWIYISSESIRNTSFEFTCLVCNMNRYIFYGSSSGGCVSHEYVCK